MKDRFKYKVWDKKREKFIDRGIVITVDGRIGIKVSQSHPKIIEEDLIFLQCTSSKDINGVLIYERDILRLDGCLVLVIWMNDGFKLIGEDESEGFNGRELFPQTRSIDGGNAMWGEIVGNEYENSDILGGTYL